MSWLTADELEWIVKRTAPSIVQQAFRGVFPHNRLPTLPTTTTTSSPPTFTTMIVNTDSHNLPGRHWTSVYIDKERNEGELFDPLVTPPSAHVVRFLTQHCRKWSRNYLIYQHPLSSYCGLYVLLHVLHRHEYDSLDKFCSANFTSSPSTNEQLIRAYYLQQLLPYF